MLQAVENILWWLVLIGVMIMIHELGHFWAARFFDVKVEVFSFGFGPRLFGFRRGETDYRVSAVPFGGYVKMSGEQFADDTGKRSEIPGYGAITGQIPAAQLETGNPDDPRSLLNKPRWQRLIISVAGPFMNVVLAVGLLAGLYMFKYEKVSEADLEAVIGHVAPDSPAAKAGLLDGDRIVALDGKANPTWEDIGLKEIASADRPMHLAVDRNGKRFDTTVTPVYNERLGMGYAGWDERGQIQLGEIEPNFPAERAGLKRGDLILAVNGQPIHSNLKFQEIIKGSGGKPVTIEFQRKGQHLTLSMQPVYAKVDGPAKWMIGVQPQQKLNLITTKLSLPDAVAESVRQNEKGALLIAEVLQGMVERRVSTKNLAGPIAIGQIAGDAAREGPSAYFSVMSMVSLNLAIFNLLPIPILDGGTILMLLVEILMQRDLSINVKEAVFKVGFVFIMVIMAFVIFNDISKLMLPPG
jgi:regulator of sigma E protease